MSNSPDNHPQLFGQFPVLNGLRGLCLMWVMFVHLPGEAVLGSFLTHIHNHWRFGVDFFFAISGFLVTRSLFQCDVLARKKGQGQNAAAWEYLIRRASRIWPSYFATLLILGAIAVGTHNQFYAQIREIGTPMVAFPLFAANFIIPAIGHAMPHAFIVFWSVSFQEQFYFLIAGLYRLSRRHLAAIFGSLIVISVLARLILSIWVWPAAEDYTGYMECWLPLNFDGLAWGCLVWLGYDRLEFLWRGKTRSVVSSLLLSLVTIAVIAGPSYAGEGNLASAILSTFKAPLLALCVRMVCAWGERAPQFILTRVLSNKWLGELGFVSYEVYLLNILIYGFVQKAHITGGVLFLATALPASVLAGWAFYYGFGKPAQDRFKGWLRRAAA